MKTVSFEEVRADKECKSSTLLLTKEDYSLLKYSVRVAEVAALLFEKKHFRLNNKNLIGG